MNILNLVLYSISDDYNMMKKYTENYYKQFNTVKTIYYLYSNEINNHKIQRPDNSLCFMLLSDL